MNESSKLPPRQNDQVIEVSMRHVIFAFGGLAFGILTIGVGITFARDYARYRRQKAIIDSITQLLLMLKQGGECIVWKKEKTASLSNTRKSNAPEKSSATSASEPS